MVAPSASLTTRNSPKRSVDRGEPPMRADRDVEGAARRGLEPGPRECPEPRQRRARAAEQLTLALHERFDAAHRLARHGRALEQRVRQQLRRRGHRARQPSPRRRCDRLRVGARIENDACDVDAGDAVDQRVMGLRDQREAPVTQPLYQPQLPEWAPAVERLREDAAGKPAQLRVATGLRQGRVTDMEGETELRVVHPYRASLLQRHECEPLAVPRDEVQPLADGLGRGPRRREPAHRRPRTRPRAYARHRPRGAETSCQGRCRRSTWAPPILASPGNMPFAGTNALLTGIR